MRTGLLFVISLASAAFAATPRDVEFTAKCDGTAQRYVWVLPDRFNPAESHDVLIALHGHGSDRWQFVKDGRDECRASRDAAAEHGMIFVSPDYRAKTSWMGPKAEADLVQIISNLRREYRVGKIFLCGGSMGGSSALTFAALHSELLAGVVSMNGTANHLEYDNFQNAIRESFGGTKAEIPVEYKKRSAEYWPERFTMPVAISAGGKDTSVPPGSVIRLARVLEKMNRPVLLVYREDGGHSTDYADARQLFDFVLKQASTQPATSPSP